MQTRTLGRTGWQVSEIGLGTEYLLNQPPEVMAGVMQAAVEAGINVMDLLYNGPRFWNAFTPIMQQHRNRMIVAAHWGVGEQDGQLENVRDQAVCQRFFDDTLRRLGNDYADIAMLMMVDTDALWDSWGHRLCRAPAALQAAGSHRRHRPEQSQSGHRAQGHHQWADRCLDVSDQPGVARRRRQQRASTLPAPAKTSA